MLFHTIFFPFYPLPLPHRSESNIQFVPLVPNIHSKSALRAHLPLLQIKISVGFLAPHYHVTAFPLALLIHLELDQNQFTSHRTILPFLQSITGFRILPLRDQSLDKIHRRFSLPPPPLPTFASSASLVHASRITLALC
jgi:hypothetical protein